MAHELQVARRQETSNRVFAENGPQEFLLRGRTARRGTIGHAALRGGHHLGRQPRIRDCVAHRERRQHPDPAHGAAELARDLAHVDAIAGRPHARAQAIQRVPVGHGPNAAAPLEKSVTQRRKRVPEGRAQADSRDDDAVSSDHFGEQFARGRVLLSRALRG